MPRVAFSSSNDNGVSWSPVKYLSRTGFYTSPIPAVSGDGTIIVTFEQYWDTNAVWVVRSTDDGKTFSAPSLIARYKNLGAVLPSDSLGYQTLGTGSNLVMVNSFPSIAVAGSRAYIAWSAMGDDGHPHVYMSRSSDNGLTWAPPRATEADSVSNAYSRYYPWVAADPITGDVAIEYYCVPSGPSSMQADQYFAHSMDSGQSFRARKISSLPSILSVTEAYRQPQNTNYQLWFYGDYINLAGYDGSWHPVWTDSRSGDDNDVYTATVQPYAPMPVENLTVHDTVINGAHAQVIRWTYLPQTTFGYGLPKDYYFIVDNIFSADTVRNGQLLSVDMTSDTLRTYRVCVVADGFRSIEKQVLRTMAGVGNPESVSVSVGFSRQPASVNETENVSITSETASSVTLILYDELGREIAAVTDPTISLQHTLRFTPTEIGASYYIVRGMTASGSWQRTGRFLTLPSE
jgi:hypothetical protein